MYQAALGHSGTAGLIHISGKDNLWQKQNNKTIIFGNQNN